MQRSTRAIHAAAILALLAPGFAAAQSAPAPTVSQRFNNQQQRINQGVASGQLTHHEAVTDERHLKTDEAVRQRQRARDNGAPLTAQQRARDNHLLNNNSARIQQTKHNGKVPSAE